MSQRLPVRVLFALALSAAMVLTGLFSVAPPARADDPAPPENQPGPVLSEWTPTTQVMRNEDGTLTATMWTVPVQAPDPSSETGWSPVDTSLEPTAEGFEPSLTDATVAFTDGTAAGPMATVSIDAGSVSVDWPTDLPAPSIEGDTATYESVLPGVDATLQATATGFEQSFVVQDAAHAPQSLDIPLALDGLAASLTDAGALVLTTAGGDVVGGADPALMWGADTDPLTGEPTVQDLVPTTLTAGAGGPVLTLTPDPDFFTDPAVTFPVVIDPVVSLSMLLDTSVNSASPTTGYPTATTLRSGHWSTGETYRAYIGFDRAAIAGTHIQSATLSLHQTWAASCTPTQVDAYEVTNLVSGTITWNNQPTQGALYAAASAAYGGPSCATPGTVALQTGGTGGATLGTLVQKWADGTSPPAMVEIRAHDQNDATGGKIFTASEGGSNGPVLSVTYNSFPDVPTGLYAGEDLGPLEFHGTFSDPDGGTGSVQYKAFTDDLSHTEVLDVTGATVPSGGDSVHTLTPTEAALIPDTDGFVWSATSEDGTDSSVASPEETLTKDLCMLESSIDNSRAPTRTLEYSSFTNDQNETIPLLMDEYALGTNTERRPAIILVHGGGWTQGCRRTLNSEAWTLSTVYGFDVFSIDYRLACLGTEPRYSQDVLDLCKWPYQLLDPDSGLPAAATDVQKAIASLKNDEGWEDDFPAWDGEHVAALGTSAGGTVLLTAVELAATANDPTKLPDVVATWSAKMEFATFDETPDDGWDSNDTCDHAKLSSVGTCWKGVDHYLDSFDELENPDCGFDENGDFDRDTTDLPGPTGPGCTDDGASWYFASPRTEWDEASRPNFPAVFIANGGGPDDTVYGDAETVSLREAKEFVGVLEANGFGADAFFCRVDTTAHGTHYETQSCEDATETVFQSTVAFIETYMTS